MFFSPFLYLFYTKKPFKIQYSKQMHMNQIDKTQISIIHQIKIQQNHKHKNYFHM